MLKQHYRMQLEFFDVPSPCIGVCQTDDKGYCLGCMRTREERQTWLNLSAADRQKVIKRCRQRKKRRENANKPKVVAQEIEVVQHSLLDPPASADIMEQEPSAQGEPPVKEKTGQSQIQIEPDMDFSDFEL